MTTKQIAQVIVVEGKTDTQKLQKIFGPSLKTIATNGLALNEKNLAFLKAIHKTQGLIILTDPDGPGKKIRERINTYVGTGVLNAFITKADVDKNSKKIGVAEADEQAIVNALEKMITFQTTNPESLSWTEYLNEGFYLKPTRQKLAKKLGWSPEMNSKSFFKWLNWAGLTTKSIKNLLEE